MNGRLILAIVSTFFEEAVLVVIVLLVLPQWDIRIPLWAIILGIFAWTAFSIFMYRLGSKALKTKHVVGLHNMIDCQGEVVSRLAPEGVVRVKGALWRAQSAAGETKVGSEVIVVAQHRLELIVQKCGGIDARGRGD